MSRPDATRPQPAGFFTTMLTARGRPDEVATELAAPLLRVVDEELVGVVHDTDQDADNRIECDHGRLDELGVNARTPHLRVAAAFDELAAVI